MNMCIHYILLLVFGFKKNKYYNNCWWYTKGIFKILLNMIFSCISDYYNHSIVYYNGTVYDCNIGYDCNIDYYDINLVYYDANLAYDYCYHYDNCTAGFLWW